VGLGQRTVKRWLQAGHFPERQRRREHPGPAAPFAPYLRERWAQGCHNATQLYRELRERGYRGCYGGVAALVAPWRSASYRHRGRLKSRRPGRPSDQPAYTPRQVCWLLLRPVESFP
jgi:transposase